jgi:hypothetical protein
MLPSPNLDDRTFEQLLAECKLRVSRNKQWTDFSPSDPGMVLLELFAHLTEVMIYRLNRIPEKAYVEFLRLMGVKLNPPSAASTRLQFTVERPKPASVKIPRGSRVTVARMQGAGEPPVFITARELTIEPDQTQADVIGYHCELVEDPPVKANGLPGFTIRVKRPPIVAPLEDHLDLVVGVEALPGELEERAPALKAGGKTFRIWREVEDFVGLGNDRCVYVVDRMMGVITFPPALRQLQENGPLKSEPEALGAVPAANREIRVWYCRGGGLSGNVSTGQLTVTKDSLPGIKVNNLEPAKGGMEPETVANALARGPLELHSLHRAVTARDFETIACREAGIVARAKAFTQAAIWKHAAPGTVEVLLVPAIPAELRRGGRIPREQLTAQQTNTARERIEEVLEERRPLGTTCLVDWVHYKTVKVRTRVALHREEDPALITERLLDRLHSMISPLPFPESGFEGWRFGQSLRASQVYDAILAEPGVSYVEQVRLLVDDAPDKQVGALSVDTFQPATWYAASGGNLYRSVNDAESWERLCAFPDEEIKLIKNHPSRPGWMAIASVLSGSETANRVRFSTDCGENWTLISQTTFTIDDMVWHPQAEAPKVWLAAESGLYELNLRAGAAPLQLLVDPENQNQGFFAVTVTDVRGEIWVAVAARAAGGVYLSKQGGSSKTFELFGLRGEDIRVLEAQKDGTRRFLWGGATSPGFEPGRGCWCRELGTAQEKFSQFDADWKGGSCLGLTFAGDQIVAATHHAGVLVLNATKGASARWRGPDVTSGLPMRDLENFQRIGALAANPDGALILAGGPDGIYRSKDTALHFSPVSGKEFVDQLALPETWLFCSGDHEIKILNDDEAKRD